MSKDKLNDYSATNASNTDVGGINVDEGMLPSAVNNALRELMTHLKEFSDGTEAVTAISVGDNHTLGDDADDNLEIASSTSENIVLDSAGGATVFKEGGTEVARLTGGQLGIGITSPSNPLHVFKYSAGTIAEFHSEDGTNNPRFSIYGDSSGTHLHHTWSSGAGNLIFEVGGSAGSNEMMRIDSSGNLLHGTTTSSGAGITIANDLWFQKSGYSDWKLAHFNGGFYFNNGTDRVVINSSGSLNATGGLQSLGVYNNTTGSGANLVVDSGGGFARSTSSQRYKNTINDATHGLTELLTLRPVTYKHTNDGDTIYGGLIAEEVHTAGLTEFVQYSQDDNGDDQPEALYYGNMVSLCIKAIQEQQETITALEARIAALEVN